MNSLGKKLFFLTLIVLITLSCVVVEKVKATDNSFPRKANYFLKWNITDAEAIELAKWDLLVLDMETQIKSKNQLKKIRRLNPDIVMLAYITPQEIAVSAATSDSFMRKKLASGIEERWYLKNDSGENYSFWPGTIMLNVADTCPKVNNKRLNEYVAEFVVEEILSTNLWDGVFYDNAWNNLTWFTGIKADLNRDGLADSFIDNHWVWGMEDLYNLTRSLVGDDIVLVGNAHTRGYKEQLNGKMIESFSSHNWQEVMDNYKYNQELKYEPRYNIINANTLNEGGKNNYQKMRYGLASSLLEDGYFSFDYGDTDHSQLWWYDEYGVDFGEPLGASVSENKYTSYGPDVWQRNFTNGLVLVNSTDKDKSVILGGEYEKIHGTQDQEINDGSIVTETIIGSYDGLLLLKTFDSLQDVLFKNGDFVRFFNKDGDRVRNGFFVFEEEYKGGDRIAYIDLDGNGRRDLVVVSKNKIMAWRDDGQIYMKIYPYTAMYRGELRVAIGDLNKDKKQEIYVAPSAGYNFPIKVYTRHGRKMKQDWYPYGESYAGGYSMAILEENKSILSRNSLLVGKASGESLITVFDYNYQLAYQWLAFDKSLDIGVNLATGDLDGDSLDEVIVGTGVGYGPIIRVLDKQGNQLYDDIEAYSTFSKPGIEVLSIDVNYDGKDDIVSMGSGF